MSNTVNLEFAGDASKLAKAGKQAEGTVDDFGKAAVGASEDLGKSSKASIDYTDKIGKLGAGISGMTDAVDSAGAAVGALADLQNAGRERAARLARAQADVEQAMIDGKQAAVDLEQATLDLGQAQTDGKQAAVDAQQAVIDKKQADLDAKQALDDYNTAVKENGKNSDEAKQALIDMAQANADQKQAAVDAEQAQRDATQATIDGKQATVDSTQAVRDGKDAQLDLNDAMSEANPSGLQQWADHIEMITPILSGLVGVVGLVTAAQWAWNAAQLASPLTWIILAIGVLIAIIVVIAVKTDWFQKAWKAAWGWIKSAASAVGSWFKDTLWGKWIKGAWDAILNKAAAVVVWFRKIPGMLKAAFSGLVDIITWPYRTAFNLIATAWNATIGKLSWTVPGWVPGIGGASISAPRLPKFHTGGTVPGPIGQETLAVLQGGEVVSRPGDSSSEMVHVTVKIGQDTLIEAVTRGVRLRGGNVQAVLGGRNG
jgi:hypothetical protein